MNISEKLKLPLKLFPYQEQGVFQAVKTFKGRALIADEMGLGKSAQALAISAAYSAWPLVIVCPASLRLNWRKEIELWLANHIDPIDICVVKTSKDKLYGRIIIFSYEMAAQRSLDIALLNVKMIVLDESHYIKNPKSLRTKRLLPLCKAVDRCILLTGTPILNRPVELWAQLEALNRSFGKYWDYGRRYCNLHKNRFGWDFSGASNLAELNKRLRDSCMVRRLKKDVLQDLPPKRRVKIVLDGLGKSSDMAELKLRCMLAYTKTKSKAAALELLRSQSVKLSGVIFKAYHEVGKLKAKFAAEWVIDNSSVDSPLVLFAHHSEVLDQIESILKDAKITTKRIDGSTPLQKRQAAVDEFQAGKVQAILLSITAASTGLTLTKASDMVIVELPFGPGLAAQAEDRIHRIGQSNAALIRYLVAEKTIDEALWGIINKKTKIVGSALDGEIKTFDSTEVTSGNYWALVEQVLDEVITEPCETLKLPPLQTDLMFKKIGESTNV